MVMLVMDTIAEWECPSLRSSALPTTMPRGVPEHMALHPFLDLFVCSCFSPSISCQFGHPRMGQANPPTTEVRNSNPRSEKASKGSGAGSEHIPPSVELPRCDCKGCVNGRGNSGVVEGGREVSEEDKKLKAHQVRGIEVDREVVAAKARKRQTISNRKIH